MNDEQLRALATITANLVYGYQGSDPEIIKKQIGIDNAVDTLRETIDTLMADQKRLILEKTNPFPEKTTEAYWFTRAGITAGKIYQEAIDDYMNSIKE